MSAREGQAFGGQWDASTARIVPSQSVLELYLLRHGAVESLDARVVRGQQDVALSAEGLSQHAALAGWLAPRLPQAVRVCSSDLVRCRDLAVRLGRPVHIDTRLREQSMGAWEGRTWPAITQQDPELVRAYWSDYARTRPAGGESLLDVQQRALQFLGEQLDREGPLVLVTHIGIIRSLLCAWLGVPLESALRFAPATGSCTHVLLSEAGAVLNSFGERPWAFTKARTLPAASRTPRIALSGSAGTGKTTLGRRLAQELGVPFLEEQMRARLEAGFDLHSLSPEALRELILSDWRAQRAEEERCTQGFVADRSSLDYAAFWLHYHLHEDAIRTRALVDELAREAQRYDRILLCPHGVLPLVDDGVRSTNPWTQLRFQAIVEGLLDRHSGGGRVLRVANSTDFEARVRAVLADLG